MPPPIPKNPAIVPPNTPIPKNSKYSICFLYQMISRLKFNKASNKFEITAISEYFIEYLKI